MDTAFPSPIYGPISRRGFLIHFIDGAPYELHITVLAKLIDRADLGFGQLLPLLEGLSSAPVVSFGDLERFGLFGEHEVMALEDRTGELSALHRRLARGAVELGFELEQPQFAFESYRPHITLSHEFAASAIAELPAFTANELRVDSISLMESSFDALGRLIHSECLGSVRLADG